MKINFQSGESTILYWNVFCCCSVGSHIPLSVTPWIAVCQASLSFTISQGLQSSCSLNRWCHPTISSSVILFSFCLQPSPASGSYFPKSQLFTSSGQSIGASASASILSMTIQSWFPLRLTGLISLLSMGLSRVFSSTTVQKHQFFRALPSLQTSSHICTCLLERS